MKPHHTHLKTEMVLWYFVPFFVLISLSSRHNCIRVFDKFHVANFANLQPFRIIQPTKWKGCTHQCKLRSKCEFVVYKRQIHSCYLLDSSHVYEEIGTSYLIGRKQDWNMVRSSLYTSTRLSTPIGVLCLTKINVTLAVASLRFLLST